MSRQTELIDRYCSVWGEPDADNRARRLAEVWADGATYTDPTVHAEGSEELLMHIAGVLSHRPGAKVMRTSVVDVHHGLGHFVWQVVAADGHVLREGIDIAFFSADGARIERMIGFFAPFAPRNG
jgi:hypothetical protein